MRESLNVSEISDLVEGSPVSHAALGNLSQYMHNYRIILANQIVDKMARKKKSVDYLPQKVPKTPLYKLQGKMCGR